MIMIIKCDNRDAFKSLGRNQISPFVLLHKFNDLKDGISIMQSKYTTIRETLALFPAKHFEYDTIVIERERKLYIRQTPLQIIKASCQNYWSTYEGRRDAVVALRMSNKKGII